VTLTHPTTKRETDMRAMTADKFSGYEALNLVDLPKPAASDGKVLLRMTAAGVTPLDHTTRSNQEARFALWIFRDERGRISRLNNLVSPTQYKEKEKL